MRLPVLSITDVAERGLCCGCGACAAVDARIEMVDDLEHGRRPVVTGGRDADTSDALRVCPGVALEHDPGARRAPGVIRELFPGFGPVLALWEGHAADPEIRFAGSSGGAASALALHGLEREGLAGVLHIAARQDAPHLNRTVLSTTRRELLDRTGSRYAPASPCDGLGLIEEAPGPCVFIGKPCDAAAVLKARRMRPALDAKLGLTIAFFCAGTPSTRGTFEMLRRMGVEDPRRLISLRYRGNGWPGLATAVWRDGAGAERSATLTYEQSWGEILTNYKQWRCKVCADHTGEFADVAVGDPWHRPVESGGPGLSLILARTPRGRDFIERAIECGALEASPVEPGALPASQPNLLKTRGAVWGRSLASRLCGVPAPRHRGLAMFRFWLTRLSTMEKIRSLAGTARRIAAGGLRRPRPVVPMPVEAGAPTGAAVEDAA